MTCNPANPQPVRPHDGKLVAAQVVGRNAVDCTIDALATAMQAGMTVFDLERLELNYAPPYGAARDPVNIAGYVAANRLRGDTNLVDWTTVQNLVDGEMHDGEYGILDVHTRMMKQVKSRNTDSLPRPIETAMGNGVRIIACQMSMDMMGNRPEELLDGVRIGGVAAFISETDKANAALFIQSEEPRTTQRLPKG